MLQVTFHKNNGLLWDFYNSQRIFGKDVGDLKLFKKHRPLNTVQLQKIIYSSNLLKIAYKLI